MEDLHHTYSFGEDLSSVLRYFKAFNFVALASIAVSILPINGILLQQATTIHSVEKTVPFTMSIPLAQKFPTGYTGIITSRGSTVDLLTSNFTTIVQDYNIGVEQNLSHSACNGRCSGIVQAAGYAIKCSTGKSFFNVSYEALLDPHRTNGSAGGMHGALDGPAFFSSMFNYSMQPVGDTHDPKKMQFHPRLNFSATFKDIDSCAGDLQIRNCTLEPAVLKQRVILENQTLTLDPAFDYTSDIVVQSPILVDDEFSASRGAEGVTSTHGGMAFYLQTRFNSFTQSVMEGLYGLQIVPDSGIAYMEYMTSAGGMGSGNARCNITWR
jgi:hypothetical protein